MWPGFTNNDASFHLFSNNFSFYYIYPIASEIVKNIGMYNNQYSTLLFTIYAHTYVYGILEAIEIHVTILMLLQYLNAVCTLCLLNFSDNSSIDLSCNESSKTCVTVSCTWGRKYNGCTCTHAHKTHTHTHSRVHLACTHTLRTNDYKADILP